MRHPLMSRECMYGNVVNPTHTYIIERKYIYIHIASRCFHRDVIVSRIASWNNREHRRTSTEAEIQNRLSTVYH